MILGVSPYIFTLVHSIFSLAAILSGGFVVYGFFKSRHFHHWIELFLLTSVLTSVTGFLFPSSQFGPAHIVGVISLVILALAFFSLYFTNILGVWRWIYVSSCVTALYLNIFVGIVQSFRKLKILKEVAPTQTEPAFLLVQVAVLIVFFVVGVNALRAFHPERKLVILSPV